MRGMSQSALGSKLSRPVTFQQIQKYERGANHVTAVCLYEIATALQLPFLYFLPETGFELPILSIEEMHLLDAFRQLHPPVQSTLLSFAVAASRSS